MKFKSTRGQDLVPLRQALEAGLAPDGGLYIPESCPYFSKVDFEGCSTLAEIGTRLLQPFFQDDPILGPKLSLICENTFQFEIPLTRVQGSAGAQKPSQAQVNQDYILELYHGPTSAFKDVGARFLAECISALATEGDQKKRTVIVATSGDTGGAVAAAFFEKHGIDVVILFPKGRVSPRQEAQLCAWGGNVQALAVEGTFDDCQRLVKETLLGGSKTRQYLSANSINLGRILPQMIYYAFASLALSKEVATPIDFIIPSGNLGNALAALWAKKMGLPIGRIHLAFNANHSVVDYFKTGQFKPSATIATLANAMDVGNPSNFERVMALYPSFSDLNRDVSAQSILDSEISEVIRTSQKEWGQILCPHTATAAAVRKKIKALEAQQFILVSTAHPVKFETIVEPLISEKLPIPPSLDTILRRPVYHQTIAPNFESLKRILNEK